MPASPDPQTPPAARSVRLRSTTTLNLEATQAGVGIALDTEDGTFYVVILVGE